MDYINNYLKNSIIFVPFRDPLQQSISLMRQHENFKKIHKENNFSLEYMNFLGHHEFGGNHKQFNFNSIVKKNNEELDYWINLWLNTYSYLFNKFKDTKNIYFICYENLAEKKELIEQILTNNCETEIKISNEVKFKKKFYDISYVKRNDLINHSLSLYEIMNATNKN